MDPARINREPDVENLRTDFIGCPSLLTRHAKKKKIFISWNQPNNETTGTRFIRDIFNLTRCPEQYNDEFKTDKDFRKVSEYRGGIVIFDDIKDYNKKIDPISTRRRHKHF